MTTAEPLTDFIPGRHGSELMVALEPGPVLVIAGGWRRGGPDGEGFAFEDRYTVREIHGPGAARVFVLGRAPEKTPAAMGPGSDRSREYEVTVTATGGWCTCRGFQMNNEERAFCKHIYALRHVAAALVQPGRVE